MQQFVTQAEFARHRGVARQMVGKWISAGRIALHERPDGRKLIDLAEADFALGATVARVMAEDDDPVEPAEKAPAAPGLTAARTEREQYAAKLAALEYEERIGKLRSIEEFEASISQCLETAVRAIDRISGRADELAAAIARDGVMGARVVLRSIRRELRNATAAAFSNIGAGEAAADAGDDDDEAE